MGWRAPRLLNVACRSLNGVYIHTSYLKQTMGWPSGTGLAEPRNRPDRVLPLPLQADSALLCRHDPTWESTETHNHGVGAFQSRAQASVIPLLASDRAGVVDCTVAPCYILIAAIIATANQHRRRLDDPDMPMDHDGIPASQDKAKKKLGALIEKRTESSALF